MKILFIKGVITILRIGQSPRMSHCTSKLANGVFLYYSVSDNYGVVFRLVHMQMVLGN
jgi:hypothetical protein